MSAKSTTIPWLELDQPARVAVIGDIILDEYLEGTVFRISPEAPVPVHHVTRSSFRAGGAGNAARNIKMVGGDVVLFSVWGADEAGRNLRELLDADGIETHHVQVSNDRPTVRKMRVTAGSHQIVRVDWEHVSPISEEIQDKILRSLQAEAVDAILVSDYGKGALPIRLLTNVLEYARSQGIPAVVDPKGRDFSKYLHSTLITPNMKEACDALNLDPTLDWSGDELGRRLQKTYGLNNVLVTMGPKGMVLVPANPGPRDTTIELPSVAREVYDVTGAGDTVVGLMALGLAANVPMEKAMHIANTAAGLVVEKWGTHPVLLNELQAALQIRPHGKGYDSSHQKITTVDELVATLHTSPKVKKRVVFTNGCFDILHAGHVSYLEEARSLGDCLIVGVNDDESVRRLKGSPRPFISLDNRLRVLAGLGCVDYVIAFGDDTPLEVIKKILPDVLVKGADWEKTAIVGADVVEQNGGSVDTIKYLSGLSTTEIVNRIRLS